MPIDELLQILRSQKSPELAWKQVLDLCRKAEPSQLWDSLPEVDFKRDAQAVLSWIEGELADVPGPCGVYLGLDTLNMEEGQGTNLAIGWSADCDTSKNDVQWIYERLNHGSDTLIEGLYELHAGYSQPQWDAEFGFADYVLFLAYSGLVLREVLSGWSALQPMLFAWGFPDGDMFVLGRSGPAGFELVCA